MTVPGVTHRQVLHPLRVGFEVTTRFLFNGRLSFTDTAPFILTLDMIEKALHVYCM